MLDVLEFLLKFYSAIILLMLSVIISYQEFSEGYGLFGFLFILPDRKPEGAIFDRFFFFSPCKCKKCRIVFNGRGGVGIRFRRGNIAFCFIPTFLTRQ